MERKGAIVAPNLPNPIDTERHAPYISMGNFPTDNIIKLENDVILKF